MAYPEPTEVAPWYLRNITQALALDTASGNVYVRTDAQFNVSNANIVVSNVGVSSLGNVNISGNRSEEHSLNSSHTDISRMPSSA